MHRGQLGSSTTVSIRQRGHEIATHPEAKWGKEMSLESHQMVFEGATDAFWHL